MTIKTIDEYPVYTGPLGPSFDTQGKITLRLWAPGVKKAQVELFDPKKSQKSIGIWPLEVAELGLWQTVLSPEYFSDRRLYGCYYQYILDHRGPKDRVRAMDPYAPSMAVHEGNPRVRGKGALVDPTTIGPSDLDFARIPGFTHRGQAIIWEIHVRDFTSDPSIEGQLSNPFGTFGSFCEKLDYIQKLGVTHIQLLPVMAYYFGDETKARERQWYYSSANTHYNWGYDPHSYFSLTGMYSANPADPAERIREFKELVKAVHSRGIGVILDVVYNHTGALHVLEDIVPGYYHFLHRNRTSKSSFGGGRLGTTHPMARKLMIDSLVYWTREYKVDGFRFDMMGDHDSQTLELATQAVLDLNPQAVLIGEGWRTYEGDDDDPRIPADQDWVGTSSSVGVFSDEFRNELKSGYGSEGEPRFLSRGPRDIGLILDSLKAQPHNFFAREPANQVSYIEAHDNLTLHDVLAYALKKDPEIPENEEEMQKRIRLGNLLVLTSQGIAFLHAGQEYGRSKQWQGPGQPEHKDTFMVDRDGKPFTHPFFVHDSYDSTDRINKFDWQKATSRPALTTVEYTAGLVALRRSTDAFTPTTREEVERRFRGLNVPEILPHDLVVGFQTEATDGTMYTLVINADEVERSLTLPLDLHSAIVLVDNESVDLGGIPYPRGFGLEGRVLRIQPLTGLVFLSNPLPPGGLL